MIHRPSKPRRNLIPYAALLLAFAVGVGGVAVVGSRTTTGTGRFGVAR